MSEYFDGFGTRTTVRDVFRDLYEQVDISLETLDAARQSEPDFDKNSNRFGDTDLSFVYGGSSEFDGDSRFSGEFKYKGLEAFTGPYTRFGLVSRSEYVEARSTVGLPARVSAYRGQEFMPGDYCVENTDEQVRVTLGRMGLFRVDGPKPEEPFGTTFVPESTRVNTLEDRHRERLDVVAEGIISNIAVAELIATQGDAMPVIEAAGKPIRQLI